MTHEFWEIPDVADGGEHAEFACVADDNTNVLATRTRFIAVRFRERSVHAVWPARYGHIIAVQVAANGVVVALERASRAAGPVQLTCYSIAWQGTAGTVDWSANAACSAAELDGDIDARPTVSLAACPTRPWVLVTHGCERVVIWDVSRANTSRDGRVRVSSSPQLLCEVVLSLFPGSCEHVASCGALLLDVVALASSRDLRVFQVDRASEACGSVRRPFRLETPGWHVRQLHRAAWDRGSRVLQTCFTTTDRRGCARLLVVLETAIHIFAVTPDDAAAALCGTIALNGLILRRGMVATDGHARLVYCLTTAGLELWILPASNGRGRTTRTDDGERPEKPLLVHIQGLALASSGQLPCYPPAGLVAYAGGVAVLPWPAATCPDDVLAHAVSAQSGSPNDGTTSPIPNVFHAGFSSVVHPLSTVATVLLLSRQPLASVVDVLEQHSDAIGLADDDEEALLSQLGSLRTIYAVLREKAELVPSNNADSRRCRTAAQRCAANVAHLLLQTTLAHLSTQYKGEIEVEAVEGALDAACEWFEKSNVSLASALAVLDQVVVASGAGSVGRRVTEMLLRQLETDRQPSMLLPLVDETSANGDNAIDTFACNCVRHFARHGDLARLIVWARLPWHRCRSARAIARDAVASKSTTDGAIAQLLLAAFDNDDGVLEHRLQSLRENPSDDDLVTICCNHPDALLRTRATADWEWTPLGHALERHRNGAALMRALAKLTQNHGTLSFADALGLLGHVGESIAGWVRGVNELSLDVNSGALDFSDDSATLTRTYLETVCDETGADDEELRRLSSTSLVWLYLASAAAQPSDAAHKNPVESFAHATVDDRPWIQDLTRFALRRSGRAPDEGLHRLVGLLASHAPLDSGTLLRLVEGANPNVNSNCRHEEEMNLVRLFATPRAGRLEDSLDLLLQMVFDERNTHVTPTAPSSEQTVVVIGFANRWCGTESEHWSRTLSRLVAANEEGSSGALLLLPVLRHLASHLEPRDFIAALPADTVLSDEIFAELSAVVSVGNE